LIISQLNFRNNLVSTIFNYTKTNIGTTYTNATDGWDSKTITYLSAYPESMEKYKDNLPLIIIKRRNGLTPTQFELGGNREYPVLFDCYIIAGGYNNDNHDDYMMNSLTDKLIFLYDNKVIDFINYDTGEVVQGTIRTTVDEDGTVPNDRINDFNRHKNELTLEAKVLIYNN